MSEEESETTQIGLNNDDANRVYRIVDKVCAKHGCTANQCSAIAEESAQEVNAAYQRSTIGKAKRELRPIFIAALATTFSGICAAIGAYILGFFDK